MILKEENMKLQDITLNQIKNYFEECEYDGLITVELINNDEHGEVLELYSNLNEEDITNEGFAEMGRRYIVQKDYIEHTMPKTIAILEDLKNNDPELKKFLDGLIDKVHDYIFEAPWNRTEGSLSFAPRKEQFNFKESYKNAKNQFITNVLNKDYALEMNNPPEPDTLVYMLRKQRKIKEIQVQMSEREFGESYLNLVNTIKYMSRMMVSIFLIQPFRKVK